jgi:hypothetical protein
LNRAIAAAVLTVASSIAISPFAFALNAPAQEQTPPYFLEFETHRFIASPSGKEADVFDSIVRMYQDDAGQRRVEWYWNASHATGVTPALYLISITMPDGPRYSMDPAARTVRTFASRSDVVDADDPWFNDSDEWENADDPPRGVESVVTGEDLGEDVIFGVPVDGQRIVETYPASADGARPIHEVITDHWYSDELHQVMRIEVTDTKKGRTVTTTTRFARGAQDPALFELPADYTFVRR